MSGNENQNLRLLIVDDTSLARSQTRIALTSLGFTKLGEASNGKLAQEKLEAALKEGSPFHLVLCDWNMPEMDGLQLLTACRNSTAFAHLPFIMITAEGGQKQIFKILAAGETDYIVKPFTAELLEKKLQLMAERIHAAS